MKHRAPQTQKVYQASPWGSLFHSRTEDEVLGGGAAGPGKSLVLLMDPWIQIHMEHQRCSIPNHPYPLKWGQSQGHAIHLRRTSPMLDDTIKRSKQMFPRIYPDAVWRESDLRWIFPSGYQFSFGHCKDPDDWSQYLSREFTHIAFDEAWQFTEEQADQIGARLRCTDPVLAGDPDMGLPSMLRIRYASNPNAGKDGQVFTMKGDPYWLRSRFVDPEPMGNVVLYKWIEMSDGTRIKQTRLFMPATLWDNPDKNFVRNYEQRLQGMPHHIRQAYLYGNWYITANSFFADVWNERIHTCERFKVPDEWPKFRAMDWGFKLPGCVGWFALDEEENLFLFKEWKFQGRTDREVAKGIRERETEMGLWDKKVNRSLITGPADTQLWEKRGDSAKSKAEVFLEEGVSWVQADKTSREANAQRIYKRLADHGNGTSTPGFVIFRTCPYVIKTLPALQAEEGNPECPQDGGDDHGTDMVFYAGAFASRGKKGIPRIRERDDDDEEKPLQQGRGRFGYGSMV